MTQAPQDEDSHVVREAARKTASPKIGLVSLGCPKALVDSERIVTRLRAEGYELSPSYEGADAVVVNTCGFLNSAKEESLQAIGEALAENGRVIVTGCLGVEADRIRDQFPDVLAITGPQAYEAVVEAVHEAVPQAHDPFLHLVPPQGIRFTPRHYAYLKISEGCNHACSFCIIPRLRGPLKSRSLSDVMREAERLVTAGVQELLVISQDTSAYGLDIGYAPSEWGGRDYPASFSGLAEALGSLGVWVRMHYVYPVRCGQVALMADGRILLYLDIPFQQRCPRALEGWRCGGLRIRRRPWSGWSAGARFADLASDRPLSLGFPGERKRTSPNCSIGSARSWRASDASNMRMSMAHRPTRCRIRCRRRSKPSATRVSWSVSRRSARTSSRRVGKTIEVVG